MRGSYHLVASFDLQRGHRQIERVRSIGAGYAMCGFYRLRELLLERIDIGPADEGVVTDHRGDRAVDLGLDSLILQLQISERHRHTLSSVILLKAERLHSLAASRRAGFPA